MISKLRIVLVPWGIDDAGDDLWMLENGLVFALETVIDALPASADAAYADLYAQLNGDAVRTSIVPPLTEEQIDRLAERAPADSDAIIDAMIEVTRGENGAIERVQIAPRVRLLRSMREKFAFPDAFVFDGFDPSAGHGQLRVADPGEFFALARAVADAILEPLGVDTPDAVTLQISESWDAYCLFLKGKRLARTPDEKLGYYRQAARIDPAFFWARFNAGQLLKQQEDFAGSRREFLACTSIPNADPAMLGDTYFELGLCSIHLGDTKTARHFWDQALAYAPNNPSLLVNIAGTYEQEEDWRAAIGLHEQALGMSPDYHKAIVSLARLKTMVGDVASAIPLYLRALELQPSDALREAILGGCYLAEGDNASACQHLQRASELDPPRPAVRGVEEQPATPGDYARDELAKLR